MSLFTRDEDLPGTYGYTRECTPRAKGLKKLGPGDFAVIDAPDINRAFAQRLLAARPAAIINVAPFTTGTIPNYGPQMLLDAGIVLVDHVGSGIWSSLKSGKKALLTDDGEIRYGNRVIAQGRILTRFDAEESFRNAERGLTDHMEAYFGNTVELIRQDAPLLVDGLGVPDTGFDFAGRKVVIVSPGRGFEEQFQGLKRFIAEYDPLLIAVGTAAEYFIGARHSPDIIVGSLAEVSPQALQGGSLLVLPADPDGHAPGIERVQDLGVPVTRFPAANNSSTDLAILLAHHHGAGVIVNCGGSIGLPDIFRGNPAAGPSAVLTRMKAGRQLVDARTVSELYQVHSGGVTAWAWAVLSLLVLAAVLICIAGFAGPASFPENLQGTWTNIGDSFSSLLNNRGVN